MGSELTLKCSYIAVGMMMMGMLDDDDDVVMTYTG